MSPAHSAEYQADREMARKLLGISEAEFDAEMCRRSADYDANISRRLALEHDIVVSPISRPGNGIIWTANLELGGRSGNAQNNQPGTRSDGSTSHASASGQVGSNGVISLTHGTPGKRIGKAKSGIDNSDNDFSKDRLWPGADDTETADYFTSRSPRWQPDSACFVAGAPEYRIPKGFFGPSPPTSPLPSASMLVRKPKYVDRSCSPDPSINSSACDPGLIITTPETQSALYNVKLNDHADHCYLLFSDSQKDYYFFHVLASPPHKSLMIISDGLITLKDFTKTVRSSFDTRRTISEITVYLYGRDEDGAPVDWQPIPITCIDDWDGAMEVGQEWSCQISVVFEFALQEIASAQNPRSSQQAGCSE